MAPGNDCHCITDTVSNHKSQYVCVRLHEGTRVHTCCGIGEISSLIQSSVHVCVCPQLGGLLPVPRETHMRHQESHTCAHTHTHTVEERIRVFDEK